MKYYITSRLESAPQLNVAGPYSEFEYIYKAIDIVSSDCIYDLDIVNEVAMGFYFAHKSAEKEKTDSNTSISLSDQELSELITNEHNESIDKIESISTIISSIIEYDPYDCPF